MTYEQILSTFVELFSRLLEVKVLYLQFDPRLEPAFSTYAALAASPYIRSRTNPVPRSLIRTVRGHGAPRRMGPICIPAFFSHGFRRPHIHLGSECRFCQLSRLLWLFSDHAFFRAMSVGRTPASRYRHRAISSLRATATMVMRRMRPLRVPTRSRNQALKELPGW